MSTYFVRPTIQARYLVELLAHTGLDAPRWFGQAGLPRDLASLARFRASVEQFEALYTLARRACGDELFGFCRHKAPPGTYAVVMRLATGCRELGEFFESVTRFYALFDGGHRHFVLTRDGGRATLRVNPRSVDQARSIFFVHTMLLTAWRSAAWLAGEAIPLRTVRLDPRFAAFTRETAFLFGRDPELVAGAAELSFDATWLGVPSRVSPEAADLYVRSSLRQMLAAPAGDSLEAQVRGVLAADRPLASSDLASVAARLEISRATLARRLAARGLTFQEIKDALRRDHAIALLARDRLSVANVAERLGFSDPSAFTRAFKSWTNVAPGRYRRR